MRMKTIWGCKPRISILRKFYKNGMKYYIVVNPGKTWHDAIGFSGWLKKSKNCGIARTFRSRVLAQIVADELSESGEKWVVWDGSDILREVEQTYGVKIINDDSFPSEEG